MISKNMVSWFEIYVEDMHRAKDFYEAVFEHTLTQLPVSEEFEMEMYAFPWDDDAPNAAGALVKSNMGKPSFSGTIVYFDSEDCDTELQRVEKAGGVIVMPKTPVEGFGFCALFSDTEGNTIGLFSRA